MRFGKFGEPGRYLRNTRHITFLFEKFMSEGISERIHEKDNEENLLF